MRIRPGARYVDSLGSNERAPTTLLTRNHRASLRGLIVAGIALCLRVLLAGEVPDAFHVADRIGQAVEFQDEVKAVSFSRSTNGYYLSFGGSYPAQVLSVWVSLENYDRLPGRRALVGRTVRIKGQLESSPTGPLLKLDSPEAFALLEVADSALTKEVLDGKMDRDQFKAAIAQKFAAEDFATLEVLAEELRQSRERFSDGTWLSDAFFAAFEIGAQASAEQYASVEEKIARWEKARPGSLIALLVKAEFHCNLAWKARGVGFAREVTPEGWAGFKRELAKARELLESHPAAKMYPAYFSIMQTIALGQHWPKQEYMRLFTEATNLEPEYYAFYFKTAEYLLPRWRGKKGEWEEFAESQRQRHGAGSAGDALYARIAWSMKPYYDNFFEKTAISWETMAAGFEFLIKEHPQSRWLKNAYGYFAWKARDRVRLRKALAEIRADPDMNIWVNLENVGLAERLAESNR